MKTCSFYGFISALAGMFLVLLQYFAGLHSDAAKLGTANIIGSIGGLAIGITCIVLGIRARRAEIPSQDEFGYGSALGAGMIVTLVSSLLSCAFTYCYNAFINPAFREVMLEDAMNKMQAKGISGSQLEKIEGLDRMLFSPPWAAALALFFGILFGLIIALVAAAFLKKAMPPKVKTA